MADTQHNDDLELNEDALAQASGGAMPTVTDGMVKIRCSVCGRTTVIDVGRLGVVIGRPCSDPSCNGTFEFAELPGGVTQ